MVGVRRSSGCSRCVTRRVKCDERQPGCARCERYGMPCPGYDRSFKFIEGKPYRQRRRRTDSESDDAQSESPTHGTLAAGQMLMERTLSPSSSSSSLDSPASDVLQGLGIMIYDLCYQFAPSQNHNSFRWFSLLPTIYGENQTLDATIRCFTAHHCGSVIQNEQMIRYSRSAYGEALHRLRRSLQNGEEGFSSHIFCAVVLLCLYELFTDTHDPESWMKHAGGLSYLVKIRGPSRYRNEFDNALFKHARGLIVMHSMFSGQPCFLASPDWHEMMREQYTTDVPVHLHNSLEQFFAYFTFTPSLVHRLYSLREPDMTREKAMQIISELLPAALDMKIKMDAWYEQFSQLAPPPTEIPASTNDPLFPMVLTFSDVLSSTLYTAYYSYMVIIHEILRVCGQPGPHADMVSYFCDQICKSVEYSSTGFLGPYRVGFPLRVAIEVADPETRAWIMGRLQEFSKIYAAAQPKNFETISQSPALSEVG
ncbi:hypothetical protein N7474_010043 [Penicillium riverlandense]|uniref:uncharacterized protein n=1 Tax=Penicillium riverlandense TaxID=1903569 RepID=UPI002546D154|nr:uncharacterized protein N7474_010043 [Penicillium riverlandense]KAJ5808774.1 hypothetical protein N7474_010043 [Penicillium riverlandense]